MTIPSEAMALLTWRSEVAAKEPVTFELVDAGRARLLPGTVYAEAFEAAKGDSAGVKALDLLLIQWRWATKNSIVIPRRVASHVLETGAIWGAIHVWAEPDWLELWSEGRRLREISASRAIAANYLPD